MLNSVISDNGITIASFLSSIDAREWADGTANLYPFLLVKDYALCVTRHTIGGKREIIDRGIMSDCGLATALGPVATAIAGELYT